MQESWMTDLNLKKDLRIHRYIRRTRPKKKPCRPVALDIDVHPSVPDYDGL